MSQFGTILTADAVEEMIKEQLQFWMPTYLDEMERQTGRPVESLPDIKSWTTMNTFERWPEDALPAVIIIAPGLQGRPTKTGEGVYRASWAVGIAAVVKGRDKVSTNELSKLYAAALRAIMIQKPNFGGQARGVDWLDEKYSDLPAEKSRTLAAGQVIFTVEFDDVVTAGTGPTDPSEDPGNWPLAQTVHADIELEALP